MFRKISRKKGSILLLLAAVFLISTSSCTHSKKLIYLQDLEHATVQDTLSQGKTEIPSEYLFKPKDEVFIQISSLDPETYAFFNSGLSSTNVNNNASIYLNSYTINDSGMISLPIVGSIHLQGLSTELAQDTIKSYLGKYLKDVSVTVKLSGFKVTLLGEVKKPGKYIDFVSSMNILEALALANDLTVYGNREKIRIIREIDGREEIFTINLLDKNVIQSEYFHLLPNDIIYVEPLGTKTWGFDKFPYDILLSTISTMVTIYVLLRN